MSEAAGAVGGAASPLPEAIPIFPLPGVLLLPRGRLPLNIFEPRYLAMTRDALGGERLIGMIQPSDPGMRETNPPLYPTGCAGRITSFSEADDGRFLITLTGVSRFRIRRELPLLSGYRRVVADWDPFAGDREPSDPTVEVDRERLLRALKAYFAQRQLSADWDAVQAASAEHLVTSIAMLCPFEPGEKQALLDAPDFAARASLLTAILEMAASAAAPSSGTRH
ncbi:MAG: LON peptidase substrate-binding domain-containing protein [Alphaproteobacteria bacterium]|nr:LON peptidase substrate-binding domain-containing protein [Alphaproteobacteria bacterium]